MNTKRGYIYVIINKLNGKYYFGKTFNINSRWNAHLRNAKNKVNRRLYDAINHYGKENFHLSIINEYFAENKNLLTQILNEKETYLIELTESTNSNFGYNMAKGGDGGYLGEDAIQKMIKKKTGIHLTQEHKDKIGKGNKGKNVGKKHSKEQNEKQSLRQKGKTYEEIYGNETAQLKKEHMRDTMKGRKRPAFSKEWKENISKATKGKTWEERMGKEKAENLHKNQSKRLIGNKNSFKDINPDDIKKLLDEGKIFTEIPKILNISMTTMNYKFREKYSMTPYQYSQIKN
jgi:group I intron endonuclease